MMPTTPPTTVTPMTSSLFDPPPIVKLKLSVETVPLEDAALSKRMAIVENLYPMKWACRRKQGFGSRTRRSCLRRTFRNRWGGTERIVQRSNFTSSMPIQTQVHEVLFPFKDCDDEKINRR